MRIPPAPLSSYSLIWAAFKSLSRADSSPHPPRTFQSPLWRLPFLLPPVSAISSSDVSPSFLMWCNPSLAQFVYLAPLLSPTSTSSPAPVFALCRYTYPHLFLLCHQCSYTHLLYHSISWRPEKSLRTTHSEKRKQHEKGGHADPVACVGITAPSQCRTFIARYWEAMGTLLLEAAIGATLGITEHVSSKPQGKWKPFHWCHQEH